MTLTHHALFRLISRFGLTYAEAVDWASAHLDAAVAHYHGRHGADGDCNRSRARYRARLDGRWVHLVVNPIQRTLVSVFADTRASVVDRRLPAISP